MSNSEVQNAYSPIPGAPGVAPMWLGAKPVRNLMWVAPVVSFAVIVGFFVMLGTLVCENYRSYPNTLTPATTQSIVGPQAAQTTSTSTRVPAVSAPLDDPSAARAKVTAGTSSVGGALNSSSTPAIQSLAATSQNNFQGVLLTLLGALGAAFTQVVNFWLGSSKGSSDKTDLLAASNPAIGGKQ